MSKRKFLPLKKSFGQEHLDQVYDLIYQSSGAPQEIAQLILGFYPLKVKRIQELQTTDQECGGQISHDEETDEVYVPIGNHICVYDSGGNLLRGFSHNGKQREIDGFADVQVHGNDVYVRSGLKFEVYDKRNGQLICDIDPNVDGITKFYLTKADLCIIGYEGELFMYDRNKIRKLATHTKHVTTITTISTSTTETIYRFGDETLVLESRSDPVLSNTSTTESIEVPSIVNVKPDQQKLIKRDDSTKIVNGIEVYIDNGFLCCGKTHVEFKGLECQEIFVIGDYIWCRSWNVARDDEYDNEAVIHVYKCEF